MTDVAESRLIDTLAATKQAGVDSSGKSDRGTLVESRNKMVSGDSFRVDALHILILLGATLQV